jgi:hypothetical protein
MIKALIALMYRTITKEIALFGSEVELFVIIGRKFGQQAQPNTRSLV